MQNKLVENAARELLYEAGKSGDLLMKLRNEFGDFVKAKRAYVDTDEVRDVYLAGMQRLLEEGKIKQTLGTKDMTVFRVTEAGRNSRRTLERALADLLDAIQQDEYMAKVHSVDGEYLQCGEQVFSEIDEERIIYLEAFCYLLHHGFVQPTTESKEMSLYTLANKAALKEAI